jgi:hypothetical protein
MGSNQNKTKPIQNCTQIKVKTIQTYSSITKRLLQNKPKADPKVTRKQSRSCRAPPETIGNPLEILGFGAFLGIQPE